MRLIKQNYPTTSGQACIAMLSGKTIDEVIVDMKTERSCKYYETNIKQMLDVLDLYGIGHASRNIQVPRSNAVPDSCCILFIRMNTGNSHWVLFYEGKFYDPENGILEGEYPHGKITSYLEIYLDAANTHEAGIQQENTSAYAQNIADQSENKVYTETDSEQMNVGTYTQDTAEQSYNDTYTQNTVEQNYDENYAQSSAEQNYNDIYTQNTVDQNYNDTYAQNTVDQNYEQNYEQNYDENYAESAAEQNYNDTYAQDIAEQNYNDTYAQDTAEQNYNDNYAQDTTDQNYATENSGVELRQIDATNEKECCNLFVRNSQKNFIKENGYLLSVVKQCPGILLPFGIYVNGTMVGFTILLFDEENVNPNHRHWLYKFMIDQYSQGLGYGKAALNEVIAYFESYGVNDIMVSTLPNNTIAINLFAQYGFKQTNLMNGEEVVFKLAL